jgi:hypothetical protein
MGEKLKDIKSIRIDDSEMMVELNAGSKMSGNIIHIQNKKIRYELTERDFLEFARLIIRAKAEFDYMKNHGK